MPTHILARTFGARLRTIDFHKKNDPIRDSDPYRRNVEEIEELCKNFMPSGSGFDSGTKLVLHRSTHTKLVFTTSFHHMTDGMYDGWTDHTVSVIAAHDGWDLKVSGRDRNQIKDYIADCFDNALRQMIHEAWDNVEKEFTFTLA